jgi:site-specific DNA-methyltransferase (adenine-specific)
MIVLPNSTVYHGSNLDVLPTLPDNSVDSIVTDPPYELGFMGKSWDNSGIAYSVELWTECMRVLKPGGHLLAFSGSRTYHRMVVAIEDAGFEIRDMISWISNKTFPKSHNLEKATGSKDWQGWGTALKPTVEPIVMARKPVEGTVAANVLAYGTGGLNIDASRIEGKLEGDPNRFAKTDGGSFVASFGKNSPVVRSEGRWPANVILDPYTAELLDEQSGQVKGGTWNNTAGARHFNNNGEPTGYETKGTDKTIGGASRFFYVAKASKKDRNEGLEQFPEVRGGTERMNNSNERKEQLGESDRLPTSKNFHPTVKPTALMEYLIKLVTPEGGTVLDPFTGSGSTGKAALLNGYQFIGIELTDEYLPIIEGRLNWANEQASQKEEEKNEVLF